MSRVATGGAGAVAAKQPAMSMSASSTLDEVNEAAAGVCAEVIPGYDTSVAMYCQHV